MQLSCRILIFVKPKLLNLNYIDLAYLGILNILIYFLFSVIIGHDSLKSIATLIVSDI